MMFAADSMLGKLARWLRILGYDVLYDQSLPVKDLVAQANRENRMFLTRRKVFPDGVHVTTMFNVCSEQFPDQLHRVIQQFDLDTVHYLFTRCVECNAVVRPIEKHAAAGRVPERTWNEIDEFFECPECHTVYWAGSHRTNTLKKLQKIISTPTS